MQMPKKKLIKHRRSYSLQVPILNDKYCVIVAWGSFRSIQKLLNANGYPKEDWHEKRFEGANAVTFIRGNCHPVIAMPSSPLTCEQLGTLAHEACHAVEHIFEYIGQPIGGEVFAHSVGAVVRVTLEIINPE